MSFLLKNGIVVNVFTGELERKNVLVENGKIIGVGDYDDNDADIIENVEGKYICPGFIDGHIHIESTMLTPVELAKLCMPRGTTSIVADPHEIANVCGIDGIKYMIAASEGLPLNVYINLPSCVPATRFDESGAELGADELRKLYGHPRVLGLAEMMNYPGVIASERSVMEKINDALAEGRTVDGHAPFLVGRELDKYISAGIQSDHECSDIEEAKEKIRKGQWIMIRQGTAARNLKDLIELFDEPYAHRCLLVTDDRHPADIAEVGHIDHIIRLAAQEGRSVIRAIQMATVQAAQCFGLRYVGAVAPGYRADLLVLDDLESVDVRDVYSFGIKTVDNKKMSDIKAPEIDDKLINKVRSSFHLDTLTAKDFYIEPKGDSCRVIKIIAGQLVTEELVSKLDLSRNNGVDTSRDILKLAVIERHNNTGHKGLGFINGIGLKKGAIASSVAHDSHNLIVIGTNDEDMAIAARQVCLSGGNAVVSEGKVLAQMELPIAGLMTDVSGDEISKANEKVRKTVCELGLNENVEPFMNMAFVSLPVIPAIKMTTLGLVDVCKQELLPLFV